jgi:selenoprotein W-related protein
MAAALKDQFGVKAKLVPGSGGIFDIEVDGKLVASRRELGRFPEPDEVIALLKARAEQ